MFLHNDKELFQEVIVSAAEDLGLVVPIVEKDYYVTMILKKLSIWCPECVFKGGTSLSKCHHVIDRFSEDIDMYLNCAENFAYRSTCIKRKYGAVIVKNDVVISTGYNGSPRGFENCCDIGKCPRVEKDMHQGEGYGICRAVHAEANALLNCSREQTIGVDLYLTGINPVDNSIHRAKPCPICARTIIQAGINNVIMRQGEGADNYIILPAKELQWVLDGEACE